MSEHTPAEGGTPGIVRRPSRRKPSAPTISSRGCASWADRVSSRSERWRVFVDGALVALPFGVESLGGVLGAGVLAGGHGQAAFGCRGGRFWCDGARR